MTSEERRLKKHLQELVKAVETHLAHLDRLMKLPATAERGKEIAQLSNALEMEKDRARFFGLGIDFRRNKQRK